MATELVVSAAKALPPGAGLRPQEITARSGSNFLAGFLCLDAARREGMTAIYAFCRVADDAADDAPDVATGREHLQFWREELDAAAAGTPRTPVGAALHTTMQRFGAIAAPLHGLLRGMEMDLEPAGFADETALREYCHLVASCVGRACLPVLGAAAPAAVDYADALGQALQLTNILRDLRADAEQGRVYVPRDWLQQAGVEPEWLRGQASDAAYAEDGPVAQLTARLAGAARVDFARASTLLRGLPRGDRRALVSPRIMGAVYASLLTRLERRRGELRLPRARVGRWRKLWLAGAVALGVRG
ncbi:MAG: squalene/phytoene synthase family protein [Planctomycetes bacterium]|nr:squalene/phytoene synthase family protein [Planctomycetota bacterium]